MIYNNNNNLLYHFLPYLYTAPVSVSLCLVRKTKKMVSDLLTLHRRSKIKEKEKERSDGIIEKIKRRSFFSVGKKLNLPLGRKEDAVLSCLLQVNNWNKILTRGFCSFSKVSHERNRRTIGLYLAAREIRFSHLWSELIPSRTTNKWGASFSLKKKGDFIFFKCAKHLLYFISKEFGEMRRAKRSRRRRSRAIPELMVDVLECDGYLITYAWVQVNIREREEEEERGRHTMSSAYSLFRFLMLSALRHCCCCLWATNSWKEATSRWQSPARQKKLCVYVSLLFFPSLLYKRVRETCLTFLLFFSNIKIHFLEVNKWFRCQWSQFMATPDV